jgi:hypothetical protein
MTIRFEILALAFAILVVFGMVVGISTWLQHQFMNQIVAITRYHIPLRTIIADFDVRTDRYEMIILAPAATSYYSKRIRSNKVTSATGGQANS